MKTTRTHHHLRIALALSVTLLTAQAANDTDQQAELAKQLNNPVADLISVPFQNNCLFNVGPGNGFRELTNIQPVIPFELNANWNLISRTILPVIYQEGLFPGSGTSSASATPCRVRFYHPSPPNPSSGASARHSCCPPPPMTCSATNNGAPDPPR